MRAALDRSDWDEVGRQIAKEWDNRKRLAPGVTTAAIEDLVARARRRARRRRRSAARAGAAACSATVRRRPGRTSRRRWLRAARACSTIMSKPKVCRLDNAGVARILREIADLLEIKNDNPFKIRAYRNGADIVANHPHAVASLDANGLREIPGIGKDLAARIREIAETGGSEFHRDLVAEFPPSVLDMLHLQGVGPKTVATLYRELAVRTLDDLERAAADGRIRALRGMGPKKETLILKALEERKRHAGRHLLSAAHETADALLAFLRERAPHAELTAVGSLRRGCETCGDIDILACGAGPALMDDFVAYPSVERVLGRGETKSSVSISGGTEAAASSVTQNRPPREPGRGDAVLHRLEGAQHRAAGPRHRPRPEAERIRAVHRRRQHASRARDEEGIYRRAGPGLGAAGASRSARRARGCGGTRAARSSRTGGSPRRSAHAQHRDRRQGHDRGDGGCGTRGRTGVHRDHRSHAVARDGERPRRGARAGARRAHSRRRPRVIRRAASRGRRMRHPRRRLARPGRRLPAPRSISSSPPCIRHSTKTASR